MHIMIYINRHLIYIIRACVNRAYRRVWPNYTIYIYGMKRDRSGSTKATPPPQRIVRCLYAIIILLLFLVVPHLYTGTLANIIRCIGITIMCICLWAIGRYYNACIAHVPTYALCRDPTPNWHNEVSIGCSYIYYIYAYYYIHYIVYIYHVYACAVYTLIAASAAIALVLTYYIPFCFDWI